MIAISDLVFQFPSSDFRLAVPSLRVAPRERVAVIGPSGSGKTTLLYLLAGILRLSSGTIQVGDCELKALSDPALRAFRITKIGLVFQGFELVSYLSVLENILLPYRLHPALRLEREVVLRAEALAHQTGIGRRLKDFPDCLSHGEKQRVALCRALIPEPPLLLADEPTGNLDPSSKQRVVDLLFQQAERTGATLLVVTHDTEVATRFPRIINCREFAAGGAL